MSHHPLVLDHVSLHFMQRVCFEQLTTSITYGSRIGIIGRNGNGKSTLLKIIHGLIAPSDGRISIPRDAVFGYVPQIISEFSELSGGQRLNKALSEALAAGPNILLLDEPTNHLDARNKNSLMRMLNKYTGTLIFVSHDVQLLTNCADQIWHIDENRVKRFVGNYADYLEEQEYELQERTKQLNKLRKDKRRATESLEQEKKRAARSKNAHKHENDRVLKGAMKESGGQTAGKKSGALHDLQAKIDQELKGAGLPEVIRPKFALSPAELSKQKSIVVISNGSCRQGNFVLTSITMQVGPRERILITGDNGSGKSTFVRAILQDPAITLTGDWMVPRPQMIGYLDQHYATLDPDASVFEVIENTAQDWTMMVIRNHLNNFLFRKNDQVATKVKMLSGGEKARLSLAQIAAKSPKLLILDEVTNNLDLETREHVITVLRAYPGALMVISHDQDFLKKINIQTTYVTKNGLLSRLD